jgi:integrase
MKTTFIPPTLQDVWQDFQHTRRLKESTLVDYKKRMSHFEDWLTVPVSEISKDFILTRHQEMTAAGGAQANLCFRVLRSILSHAIERFENENNEPILKTNPVDVLKQLRRWNPSVRRKTLISKEQMQAWWQAVEQSQSDTVRDYLTVLLLTGFRKNEAACLKWKDIDFNRHVIILPTTKNGQIHVFPMGEYLEFILWERKKESNDKYIFTGRSGSRPITASSRAFANIAERSGVDFCLHDLRRTYATTAAEIGIDAYTLKRLLNHRTGNDVTAGYLNLSIDSLREAVQKIENEILARMHRRDTNPSKESTQGTKHQTPIAREAIDEIVWDSELTNLGTRTTSSGLKLYVVAYTEPDSGLLRYWLLGACSLMPVETARQMARNLLFKQLEVNR